MHNVSTAWKMSIYVNFFQLYNQKQDKYVALKRAENNFIMQQFRRLSDHNVPQVAHLTLFFFLFANWFICLH